MFNERDWRCTAVQLMPSTDPSYDNRIIASTLKMQIQTVQHAQGNENKVSGYGYGLFMVWFQVRAISCHLTSSKLAWKSIPKCTWMCWRVWWSPGAIRWSVADPGCGSRTWRRSTSPKRPRLGFRRSATTLYPSPTGPPSSSDLNLLDYFVWSYVENITNITSYNTKASQIAEYSPSFHWCLWKKHALSSGSISSWWLRLKAATLNRCQFYYIIKLLELIFSIKV